MIRPGADVLRAFAVHEPLERLTGGRGLTWRAGAVVLRPHDPPAVTDWRAGVLAALPHTSAFRTPRPVARRDGGWRAGDWEAWEYLPGWADETRIEDVIRAGGAFHRAIAHLDRPAFLGVGPDAGRDDDPWSRADRMAWGEEPLPQDPALDRLAAAFRPVRTPSQLVHGDLLGNVLFADGHPPAVIDWPPYWRPAGLGAAVAAVDAVCWHDLPADRLDALGDGVAEWSQLLVRALAFRIATLHLLGGWDADGADRHRPVIDALV
ncbi:TIGR02569 family protein [Curtobacterium pusillum]|uniref:hypothetical protein n=1 Tax=Curtobacterium pusillum TaxID=69373 RepID=UPI001C2FC062|nr:hypothetical protein [Curtobacterium pusillum]GLK30466.1 TIGR02569 family protein [Curtobacterium pusillum]